MKCFVFRFNNGDVVHTVTVSNFNDVIEMVDDSYYPNRHIAK